jgi:hypothetical protein
MFSPMSGAKTPKRTFTIPEGDSQLIRDVQRRCRAIDLTLNDSEVVRAGIAALMALPDKQFRQRVESLLKLPRGPSKKHSDID